MSHKVAGYILFESMIVLAILLFIVGLSVNFLLISDTTFASLELEKLYAYCFYLQKQANLKQEIQYLTIDVNNNCYLANDKIIKLDNRVRFDTIDYIKGPPSSPTANLTNPVTFKDRKIVFYPNEVISPGTVYLTDKQKTRLYALSAGVAQFSYLRAYKYVESWRLIK